MPPRSPLIPTRRRRTSQAVAALLVCWLVQATAQPQAAFIVERVELQGNTLLPESVWRAVAAPYLGRPLSFTDLEALREALQRTYAERGFRLVAVRIPAQEVSAGRLRLAVGEPLIENVRVSGARHHDDANVTAALPALARGATPDLGALDRSLSLVNEGTAKRTQVAFAPGAAPDRVVAEIRVEDDPPQGWLAFMDNSGNRQTGKTRYGLAWRHTNLFNRDHQINAQVVSAPHDAEHPSRTTLTPNHNVQILGLGYRIPFYEQGGSLDATFGYSSVDSGTLPNLFRVSGRGTLAGIRYTQLTRRIGAWAPRWFVAQDYRKFENRAEFGGVNFAPDIEVHPLSMGLAASRTQPASSLAVNTSLALNIPGGAHGGAQDFAASRAGATPRYRVVRFGVQYATRVGDGSLSLGADGQWSDDLLVAGEQFFAGGATTVRGFAERGVTGDKGVRFQAEVASGNLLGADAAGRALRAVAFIDGALAVRNRPTALETGHTSIASAGLGLRVALGRAALRIDAARPIHQRTGASPTSGAVHVSLSIAF